MSLSSSDVAGTSDPRGARATGADAGASRSSIEALLCAVGSFSIFLLLGLLTLERGHPEEDAYIMFRYADHVAQGRGIVFNSMGPHAEGATDFLWMLMLSALELVGMDVAVAAVVLNALGAALASFVLAKVVSTAGLAPGLRRFWLALVTITVPLLSAAMAAYGCFSAMLYAGFAVLALHTAVSGSRRGLMWLPAMALGLGLFRPDGVILASGTVVIGLVRARSLGMLKNFVLGLAAAGACGAAYFLWRYSYFGLMLPLPLYVKSRVGDIDKLAQLPSLVQAIARAMPGLGANLHWLLIGGVAGSGLVAAVTLWLLYREERSLPKLGLRALGALPYVLLLGSLTFAYQTQNFHWRFQAPIQLACLYFAFRGVSAVVRRGLVKPALGTAMVLLSVLIAMSSGFLGIAYQLDPARGGYLNVFAARWGKSLKRETRVALTEAGRFPFWSPAQCLDTIGLNSPEAAVRPVTVKMLEEFDPQILFFHNAFTMNFGPIRNGEAVVRIPGFRQFVHPQFKEAFEKDYDDYKAFPFSSVKLPSLVMAHYVELHLDQFEAFGIDTDNDGLYSNILAVRKDHDPERAIAELKASTLPENRASYFALIAGRHGD